MVRIGSIATPFVGSVSPLRDAIVDFFAVLLFEQLPRISLPEQEWLELLPDLLVSPMLTKDVSWVNVTRDMVELDHSTCNGFTDTVVGEHCMPLVKLGMGQQTTVNDSLVVSEHVAGFPQWNSHVAESATQVYDLLCSSPCAIRLRSKCHCLNHTLFLGIPIYGTFVDEVKNPST